MVCPTAKPESDGILPADRNERNPEKVTKFSDVFLADPV